MNKNLLIIGGVIAAATGAIVGAIYVSHKTTKKAVDTVLEYEKVQADHMGYNPEQRKSEEARHADIKQRMVMMDEQITAMNKTLKEMQEKLNTVEEATTMMHTNGMPTIYEASHMYIEYMKLTNKAFVDHMYNLYKQSIAPGAVPEGPNVPPHVQVQQPQQHQGTGGPNPVLQPDYQPQLFKGLRYEDGVLPGAMVDGLGNVVTD